MSVLMPEPKNTLLGKDTVYSDRYNPDLLQPIPRALGRDAIGDNDFRGTDIWRLYELSWLNEHSSSFRFAAPVSSSCSAFRTPASTVSAFPAI